MGLGVSPLETGLGLGSRAVWPNPVAITSTADDTDKQASHSLEVVSGV